MHHLINAYASHIRDMFEGKKIGMFCERLSRIGKSGTKILRFLAVRFNFWDRRWSWKLCDNRQKATSLFRTRLEMSLRVQYLRAFDHKQPVFGPVYRSEFLGPFPKPYEPLRVTFDHTFEIFLDTKRGISFRISFLRIIHSLPSSENSDECKKFATFKIIIWYNFLLDFNSF